MVRILRVKPLPTYSLVCVCIFIYIFLAKGHRLDAVEGPVRRTEACAWLFMRATIVRRQKRTPMSSFRSKANEPLHAIQNGRECVECLECNVLDCSNVTMISSGYIYSSGGIVAFVCFSVRETCTKVISAVAAVARRRWLCYARAASSNPGLTNKYGWVLPVSHVSELVR